MTRRTIELFAFLAAILIATLAFHAWLASHDEQQRLQSTLAAQKQLIDAADVRERTRNASLNDTLAQIAKLKRATQTPEQILRTLPNYLPLPQPITLVNTSSDPVREASKTSRDPQGVEAPYGSEVLSSSRSVSPGSAETPNSNSGQKSSAGRLGSSGAPCKNANECAQQTLTAGATLQVPLKEPRGQNVQRTTLNSQPPLPCANSADCVGQIPTADLKPLYNYVQDCRACQTELATAKQNAADAAAKLAALTRERDAAITAAKGGSFWRRLRRNALWFAVGAAAAYIARTRP
jgi:hypothetical protein